MDFSDHRSKFSLLPRKTKVDNFEVTSKSGAAWVVFQASPLLKSDLLKNFLVSKFPEFCFSFRRLTSIRANLERSQLNPKGIIAELKVLSRDLVKQFDQLKKQFRSVPMILVLTPQGYQLLNSLRRKHLEGILVILSEMKSLDYLIQLPRMIQEIGLKHQLRAQNEKLRKLISEKSPNFLGFNFQDSLHEIAEPQLIESLMRTDRGRSRCGLRVKLSSWNQTKSKLGTAGPSELIELVSREINRTVRNSDQVMRSAENEFCIFLSNTDSVHLSRCRERIESRLKALRLTSNGRKIQLPFDIAPFERTSSLPS